MPHPDTVARGSAPAMKVKVAGTGARPELGPGRGGASWRCRCGGGPSDQGFSVMLSGQSSPGGELILRAQSSCGPSWSFDDRGTEAEKSLESVLQKQFVTTV